MSTVHHLWAPLHISIWRLSHRIVAFLHTNNNTIRLCSFNAMSAKNILIKVLERRQTWHHHHQPRRRGRANRHLAGRATRTWPRKGDTWMIDCFWSAHATNPVITPLFMFNIFGHRDSRLHWFIVVQSSGDFMGGGRPDPQGWSIKRKTFQEPTTKTALHLFHYAICWWQFCSNCPRRDRRRLFVSLSIVVCYKSRILRSCTRSRIN